MTESRIITESHLAQLLYICIYICYIMKTICPSGYHYNGFMETHTFGHMII